MLRESTFAEAETLGRTPAILRSGRHEPAFFARMWEHLHDVGYWQGEIWNRDSDGKIYPHWLTITAVRSRNGITTHYVGTFSDITKSKGAAAEIHRLAYYDPLTHLPNRRSLLDRLYQTILGSIRSERYAAAFLLDLDYFKKINESRGHAVGDQLLVEVANRLKEALPDGSNAARLGEDEFALVVEDLNQNVHEAAQQARQIADTVRRSLSHPFHIAGQTHFCSASIGVALIREHPINAEEVLRRGELALHQAKVDGRNCIRLFSPNMQEELDYRAELEIDLRKAISQRQLLIHYQPQVNAGGQIIGAEALLRWEHPSHGLIPPDDFIPIAEESDLILSLGDWVLEAVCQQLSNWSTNPLTSQLRIAVNVSPAQLRQHDFTLKLQRILVGTGANPAQLKLELTESMVLEDVDDAIQKMEPLRKIGVSLALDDFGTGYSALSYLSKLPIDQLKIDRAFVLRLPDSLQDAVIAQTIVSLARGLGLDVIAEGVEREEQKSFLVKHGCCFMQGYLFSGPVPLLEFEALLHRRSPT